MEEVIRTEPGKRVEIIYKNGRTALAYLDDSFKFYFTDFKGNKYSEDIYGEDIKELNELLIEEGKIETGYPTEIIHNDGTTLAYFIEDLGSAVAFNLPEPKGYKHRQVIYRGNVKKLIKLVKAPIAIKL